jgi:hypothetical protein
MLYKFFPELIVNHCFVFKRQCTMGILEYSPRKVWSRVTCGLHSQHLVRSNVTNTTSSGRFIYFFLSCWPPAWQISSCCLRMRISSPEYFKSVLRLINWNEHSFAFPRGENCSTHYSYRSYPAVTGGSFPSSKAAGAWSWPLFSI